MRENMTQEHERRGWPLCQDQQNAILANEMRRDDCFLAVLSPLDSRHRVSNEGKK